MVIEYPVLVMSKANLRGNKFVNAMIHAIETPLCARASLLRTNAPVQAGAAVSAVVMSGLAMRRKGRGLRALGGDGAGLLAICLPSAAPLFLFAA